MLPGRNTVEIVLVSMLRLLWMVSVMTRASRRNIYPWNGEKNLQNSCSSCTCINVFAKHISLITWGLIYSSKTSDIFMLISPWQTLPSPNQNMNSAPVWPSTRQVQQLLILRPMKRKNVQHKTQNYSPHLDNSHVRFWAEFRIDFAIEGVFRVVYKNFSSSKTSNNLK